MCRSTYPEECHGATTLEGAVCYLRLLGKICGILYRGYHSLDGEESREISGVRWYDDKGEKPPDTTDYSCASCLSNFNEIVRAEYSSHTWKSLVPY